MFIHKHNYSIYTVIALCGVLLPARAKKLEQHKTHNYYALLFTLASALCRLFTSAINGFFNNSIF